MQKEGFSIDQLLLNESFIRYVLEKSKEDIMYWNTWISENPENADVLIKAREIIDFVYTHKAQPHHPGISKKIYEKLQQRILAEQLPLKQPDRKVSLRYYWYAASILLLVSFGFLLGKMLRPVRVTDVSSNYLEVIVPDGQRSQLILPDSTKVWLNAGTRLKYPVNFLQQSREVYLSGEAYFKVKHLKGDLPFIVHLKNNLNVRVLGTEFNVKSYESDEIIETTLLNGSVRLIKADEKNKVIENLRLKPNERAVYQKQEEKITVSSLLSESEGAVNEIELVTAWKDEELVFHNETFEDIAVKLERWFGYQITVNDEFLKQERFTGKFANNETIYQILEVFNRSESIQYKNYNSEIIITK
ncbi:MAG: DUF4974 domain-containing protein [Bacteroidales bacterium]|nr:DUF4974 domain-containing protein [Bacteroidales bacterium]